jgi:hypothetical protein
MSLTSRVSWPTKFEFFFCRQIKLSLKLFNASRCLSIFPSYLLSFFFTVNFKMEGLKLRFSNLFEGNKDLGKNVIDSSTTTCLPQTFSTDQSINQYLNENWKDALDALKPIIAKTIEEIMLPIVRSVYLQVPARYLISDFDE